MIRALKLTLLKASYTVQRATIPIATFCPVFHF